MDDLHGRYIGVDDNPQYDQIVGGQPLSKLKPCLLCGKSFVKHGRMLYCGRQHYTKCVVCGTRIDIVDKYFRGGFVPKTCCKTCADKVGVETYKQNFMDKYGVTNPMYVQEYAERYKANYVSKPKKLEIRTCKICGKQFEIRPSNVRQCCSDECAKALRKQSFRKSAICELCGKPFIATTNNSRYCDDDHYRDCVICGKSFKLYRNNADTKTCSPECKDKLTRQTNIDRYGVEVGSQSPEARQKLSEAYFNSLELRLANSMEKYGVPYTSQAPEIREKLSKTISSPEYQKKMVDIYMEKYGVSNPSQLREVHIKKWNSRKNLKASDGTPLDSSYEVKVYDFWKSLGLDVERNIPIEYEYNGETRTTFIDFSVDGVLFEVKGLHLLEGVYDYHGVPIGVKLDLYKKHHVVLITDKSNKTIDLFGKPNSTTSNGLKYLDKCPEPLIGVDITLFDDTPEFPYADDRPKCFYDVRVDGKPSASEAFSKPDIRWKMIYNRIQYSGGFIDNHQVLTAMNVTRTCKQPSWFSKPLAERLISTYCSQDVVYDLAAGWGARYDACKALGKSYVACDFNKELVDWHIAQGRDTISWHDGRTFTYDKPCSVFICPPYSDPKTGKCFEDYNFDGFDESAQTLTQCQWLKIAMENAPEFVDATMVCKVIDPGWEKYVVETLDNKSHFGINHEYVIHITRDDMSDILP